MEGTNADPSLNAHVHASPPPLPPLHTQPQPHPHSHSHSHSHSHRGSGRQGHGHHEKDGEHPSFKVKIPGHRSTRYKEKFQALRERYDRVIAVHDEHQRDLDIASEKMRRLQAENDLLLDAIYVTAPDLIHLVPPVSDPYHPGHGHDPQHPTPAPVFPPDVVDRGPGQGHGHTHSYESNLNHAPNHTTEPTIQSHNHNHNHNHNHDHSRSHSHSHSYTHSHSHTRSSSLQRPPAAAAASAQMVVENGNSNPNGVAASSRVEEVEVGERGQEVGHGESPRDEGRG